MDWFSSPVYPGDSLTVQMWVEGGQAIYRTVAQKDTPEERVVIDNGLCLFVTRTASVRARTAGVRCSLSPQFVVVKH